MLADGDRAYAAPASLKSSKYAFMSMLLLRVLNLDDESEITKSSGLKESLKGSEAEEVLPQITVPPTLWLEEHVALTESKIKVALLKEINGMLCKNVQTLQSDEIFLLDDTTLLYYEKLLNAYDFLKFNRTVPSFEAFREDDEYEDYDDVSVYPEMSRRTSASDLARPGSSARSVSSGSYKSRMSTLSRDFRKLSFLGLNGHEEKDEQPPSPISPMSAPPQRSSSGSATSPHPHRDQFNTLLSKSKFYNKLRRRDSGASYSSALSTPTSMTSNTSNSSIRRKSSQGFQDKSPKDRLTDAQKQENQRSKLEYYVQVRELAENTQVLVNYLGKPGSRASLVRLMDFVKNNVFRLVLIDISAMIVEYAHLKASRVI
ncbi:uncharacterized protein CXQ87_002263 [Candidozyma duobushaemuli]|uniref:Uncharacterized protein n=2 Tax=Candidozyma TaxID=3303203 RepID=A0ABX8I5D2_9ASCO|nr:uncharacterized protein CXQ87_002263 [[Candida] duobushaemulonis]PVH14138.1 hypothetical protein CXQ87_002263 [[Candida] duobushaemulonis]QWU87669.1 hypothetical protein CA3LBN_001934 [[Candida] haemuloni]